MTIENYVNLDFSDQNTVIKMLVELQNNKSLAKQQSSKGITLLHAAIRDDSFRLALNVLLLGADINAVDIDGNTPLHYAFKYEQIKMITFLRSQGAKVLQNKDGLYPEKLLEVSHEWDDAIPASISPAAPEQGTIFRGELGLAAAAHIAESGKEVSLSTFIQDSYMDEASRDSSLDSRESNVRNALSDRKKQIEADDELSDEGLDAFSDFDAEAELEAASGTDHSSKDSLGTSLSHLASTAAQLTSNTGSFLWNVLPSRKAVSGTVKHAVTHYLPMYASAAAASLGAGAVRNQSSNTNGRESEGLELRVREVHSRFDG